MKVNLTINMKGILLALSAALCASQVLASEGVTFPNESFSPNIHDKESLQRGAKYFVNYCSGCHSIKYQRYNRTFADLGIDPKIGAENLIFTGAKAVEQMHIAMPEAGGAKWFGKAPPDLSLMARARGSKYIYNYLLGFYVDDSRPLGFNNTVYPGASMPNPLWQLQGLQEPTYEEHEKCEGDKCEKTKEISGFKLVKDGMQTPAEYRKTVYDITNFLTYASDPSALKRAAMGPWVLIFIALLTVLFYFLKHEYWRDVKEH